MELGFKWMLDHKRERSCGRNTTMLLGCQLIDVDETHLEMLINCPTSQHIWSKLMVVHEYNFKEIMWIYYRGESIIKYTNW